MLSFSNDLIQVILINNLKRGSVEHKVQVDSCQDEL